MLYKHFSQYFGFLQFFFEVLQSMRYIDGDNIIIFTSKDDPPKNGPVL